ncbi:MAG: NAD(+)/NADH kinase [Bacilli bacterium]
MKCTFIINNKEESKKIEKEIKLSLDNWELNNKNPQFVFVIGGDGTYLRAVRKYLDIIDKVIFISINTGNLGFYSNIKVEDIDKINTLLKSNYEIVEHDLIKFTINNNYTNYTLNEVALYSTPLIGKYKIKIDGNLLEDYAGNGLVISTQSGSTGLNKSLCGSIIDDKLQTMQLSEIAGVHSNAYDSLYNSIVFASSRVITIETILPISQIVSFDSERKIISDFTKLEVRYSNKKVKNLKFSKKDFFERVQQSFLR